MWMPVLCVVILGCGGKVTPVDKEGTRPSEAQEKSDRPEVKGDCRSQATELQRFLTASDTGPHQLMDYRDVKLLVRPDAPPLPADRAPSVVIASRSTLFMGETIDDDDALAERLIAIRQRLEGEGGGNRIFFQIDGDAPWQRITGALDAAAKAGLDAVLFAFERGITVERPPRSSVDDELDKLDAETNAGRKAMRISELARRITAPCPALGKAFSSISPTAEDKAKAMIRAMGPALIECDCAADIPSIRSMMWRILATTRPLGAFAVRLDPKGMPLRLPATTTWREASSQLSPSTKSIAPFVR